MDRALCTLSFCNKENRKQLKSVLALMQFVAPKMPVNDDSGNSETNDKAVIIKKLLAQKGL